jgi:ATP-dependent DNA helicase RecG
MMLSEQEIIRLATNLESYHVERKADFKSCKSEIEDAICAFSNDLPGTGESGILLIGVDDKSGQPTGLSVTDELLKNVTSIRSDGNILPFPMLFVYKACLQGKDIVVIEVRPSKEPPVRLRGVVRIRVGPRKGIATRDEERILTERRRSFDGPFDQKPVVGTSLDSLNLDLFQQEFLPSAVSKEVLRENGRSIPEQLAALHLASPDGTPNVTGLLVLGHDPIAFIPGAYIQFLRIDGTSLLDPIMDRKELTGPLPTILRRLDEITNAHIRVATQIVGNTTDIAKPDYPMVAMQQLLRNAVIHRNYETSHAPIQWYWFSDRIEIHNPGGLFGRAAERFGQLGGNDYRNPTIAAALYQLGFVQRFGMGIPLSQQACQQNGNPLPEFFPKSASFAVIVRVRK